MKRYTIAVLLALSLCVSGLPVANATITPGSKCSKAGMKQTYKGKVHTCIALGSKLYWNNGEKVLGASATDSKSPTSKKDARKQCRADQEIELVQIERYLFSARQTLGDLQMKWGLANSTVGIDPKQGLLMKQIEFEMDRLDLSIENLKSSRDKIKEKCIPKSDISTSTKPIPNPASKRQCTTTEISMIRSLASKYTALNLQIDFFQSEITKQQDLIGINLLTGKMESIARSNFVIEEQSSLRDSANVQASLVKQQFDIANLACINSGIKSFEDSIVQAAADKAKADNLAKICVVGGICKVGNTGPGGGVVFYDAGSQQLWGRYLEVAPSDWSATVWGALWCNVGNRYLTADATEASLRAKLGTAIGMGKANTDLMLSSCSAGAAVVTRAYQGGAKSDWFLPSKDELNELCKYARGQATGNPKIICQNFDGVLRGGFMEATYWSSTEDTATNAWLQSFTPGFTYGSGSKNLGFRVRPIRAF